MADERPSAEHEEQEARTLGELAETTEDTAEAARERAVAAELEMEAEYLRHRRTPPGE
jgi:transcription elongation GreA/GreB family factor